MPTYRRRDLLKVILVPGTWRAWDSCLAQQVSGSAVDLQHVQNGNARKEASERSVCSILGRITSYATTIILIASMGRIDTSLVHWVHSCACMGRSWFICSSRLCTSPAPMVMKLSGIRCPASSSRHGLAACIEMLRHGNIALEGIDSLLGAGRIVVVSIHPTCISGSIYYRSQIRPVVGRRVLSFAWS